MAAAALEPSDLELGLAGERLAARYLRAEGVRILGRRWRTPWAELDLVARERSTLIACEVKSARGRHQDYPPGGRMRVPVMLRQRRAARALARRLGLRRARVDLIEVLLPRHARPRLTWHRGVPTVECRIWLAGGSCPGDGSLSRATDAPVSGWEGLSSPARDRR